MKTHQLYVLIMLTLLQRKISTTSLYILCFNDYSRETFSIALLLQVLMFATTQHTWSSCVGVVC